MIVDKSDVGDTPILNFIVFLIALILAISPIILAYYNNTKQYSPRREFIAVLWLSFNALLGTIYIVYVLIPKEGWKIPSVASKFFIEKIMPATRDYVMSNGLQIPTLILITIFILGCSYGLYRLRMSERIVYGSIEIMFGIATIIISSNAYVSAWISVGRDAFNNAPWGQIATQIFGAIYIIIRGMVNVNDAIREREKRELDSGAEFVKIVYWSIVVFIVKYIVILKSLRIKIVRVGA